MSRISLETKDRKIRELETHVQSMEVYMNKALESKAVLEDKVITMESRLQKQEKEVIELGRDKRCAGLRQGDFKF